MAGIVSATQRQSYALAKAIPSRCRQFASALFCLGKSENLRGTCIAAAFILAVLSGLAPHVDTTVLVAGLLVTGTGLALAASSSAVTASPFLDAKTLAIEPAPEAPLKTQKMSQPRSYVLEELLGTPDASANANGAHWSRLTSYMSHELRTPLNAVLGFSEMMKGEVFGPLGSEHYADYAKNIHRSGRTLLKSAEDALAITSLLTRVHAGNGNAAAAFHDAVSDALDFHAASLLDQRLEVRVGVDKALEVLAEPQTLRQIVINLLSEIIERAQPGAAILITSDSFIHEASISVVALNALPRLTGGNESFSMILSRTLAQLSGARLVELGSDEECWGVSVSFPLAQQRDFFARAGITGAKPAL